MIKKILLSVLVVMPLLGKNSPQEAELVAKLNKLESIRQEIAEKEKRIDEINALYATVCRAITYGYDEEQRTTIWKEANRLEQYVAHALNNNINIKVAFKEPLCPDLTVHRNELDRMQNMIVRVSVEYFFLHQLYQKYVELSTEICITQTES